MNQNKPKVSIIIPAYNASKYLKEAIDSAIKQTYENVEIIVVNDGSKDYGKTAKIAKSYGNKIKYYCKENGGVSTALNLGISEMTGDYFSWLSHDDRYYPNKIENQINYLSTIPNNDNVILYSDYDLMDQKSKVYATSIKNNYELTKKPEYSLLRGSINGITLLIPKKAFEDCGIFDENLRCVQDYELWERMQKKYTFVHQPDLLATTRLHDKQQSNINPLVLTEGEPFWINIIKNTSIETMEKLEGTEYNFYFEMFKFLKFSPYKKALKFVSEKLDDIENQSKDKIKDITVSVIIPFHNRIDMVISSVTSVLNQTHKNVEIILINDGSTDNINKLLELIDGNNKIKFLNLQNNLGPANARNVGIENSVGQYIAFLDSDDLFIESKIEKQLSEMHLKGYLFSHTSYIRKGFNNEILMNSGTLNGFVIPEIICSCGIATPTLMIHRKILDIVNFKYDISLKIGEDVCLYLSILKNIPILGIQDPLTIVNVGENTCAYNYEKQQEGLKNIINFVLNDPELLKYDKEFCFLLREYIRISNEKNPIVECSQKNSHFNIFVFLKRKFYVFKKLLWLYKNDRPELKELILYKLKDRPKLLKLFKTLVRIIKKILNKK